MAYLIQAPDIGTGWFRTLWTILNFGEMVSPRGNKTQEIRNLSLEVEYGRSNIITSPTRDLNYRFMIAEWLWIISASKDVNLIARYNSRMKEFSDDGFILNGAYGPRIMPQLPYIIRKLRQESSRQAVATIWTPNPPNSKDIPCTISIQWMSRGNKLHTTVNMRSSDAWLGLPYDFFNFSQISNLIASYLELDMGTVTMNLASSHLYEAHRERATDIVLAVNSDVDSIESPRIPYSIFSDYKSLFSGYHRQVPEPWNTYQLALEHDKSNALEWLRELSPR